MWDNEQERDIESTTARGRSAIALTALSSRVGQPGVPVSSTSPGQDQGCSGTIVGRSSRRFSWLHGEPPLAAVAVDPGSGTNGGRRPARLPPGGPPAHPALRHDRRAGGGPCRRERRVPAGRLRRSVRCGARLPPASIRATARRPSAPSLALGCSSWGTYDGQGDGLLCRDARAECAEIASADPTRDLICLWNGIDLLRQEAGTPGVCDDFGAPPCAP
jgi:hypothetical protein